MEKVLLVLQILISVFLITFIFLQPKGGGLGTSFGGGEFRSSKTGTEKMVFIITGGLVILFLLGAILNALISLK